MLEKAYEMVDDNISLITLALKLLEKEGKISDSSKEKLQKVLNEIKEVVRTVDVNEIILFNIAKIFGILESIINVYYYFDTYFGDVFLENAVRLLHDPRQWIIIGSWRGK